MSFLNSVIKDLGNEYAAVVTDGIAAGDTASFVDTGSYIFNALVSGSIYGGIPSNKVTALAGESSTGKTFFALSVVRHFLDSNPEGNVIYFESESAISKQMMEERNIDVARVGLVPVVTVQEFRTQAMKIVSEYEKLKESDRPPLLMVLDSLGNLSTSKEMEDSAAGKDTRDMTRFQVVKSIFRVLTLNLGRANIPLLVTNHTYEVVGAYVPMKEMSGGTGLKYAASNIIFLSKAKEKDGTEVVGNIITATNRKSRFTKENSKVKTRLFYDERGLDRYFGLLELGEQYGVFERVGNRYKVGDKSVYPKQILADPEKYFTEDVMQALDEAQQRSSSTVMNERIERTILRNLFRNEEFYRKVLPFIKSDYYEELNEKVIFEEIRKFADKYDRLPTEEVVLIEIERRTDVSDQTFGEVRSICQSFTDVKEDPTKEWLTDATEKWCKDRAIYLALMESIRLADGDDKDEKKSRDSIPDILKEASWRFPSMTTLVTTISQTTRNASTSTRQKRRRSHMTWSSLIRSPRVASLTRPSTSPWRALEWVRVCLCVTRQHPAFRWVRTSYT